MACRDTHYFLPYRVSVRSAVHDCLHNEISHWLLGGRPISPLPDMVSHGVTCCQRFVGTMRHLAAWLAALLAAELLGKNSVGHLGRSCAVGNTSAAEPASVSLRASVAVVSPQREMQKEATPPEPASRLRYHMPAGLAASLAHRDPRGRSPDRSSDVHLLKSARESQDSAHSSATLRPYHAPHGGSWNSGHCLHSTRQVISIQPLPCLNDCPHPYHV